MKLFSPDSVHWHQRDSVACHTVPPLKGEPRSTTPRDARKLGLLPSVANIFGVIAKRVMADSQTTYDSAADFGTVFHTGVEHITHMLEINRANLPSFWLNHNRDWYQANALVLRWIEKVLIQPECGYAATADLFIERSVHGLMLVDLKTMKVKLGMKATPYKSWRYQLAAYRWALGEPVKYMNLIVNSFEPSALIEHVWRDNEIETGWQAFTSTHRLWVIEKDYDPTAKASIKMMLTA